MSASTRMLLYRAPLLLFHNLWSILNHKYRIHYFPHTPSEQTTGTIATQEHVWSSCSNLSPRATVNNNTKITTPGCLHSQCCPVAPTKTSDQCPPAMSQSSFFLHHCVRVRVGGGHLKPIRFPSTLHVSLCTHQLLLQGLNL